MKLPNCWELKKCGREAGGPKVAELGECVASVRKLGHSCWAIAGTLCGGVVQGTFAQKEKNCMECEVYKKYNRLQGTYKSVMPAAYPDEEKAYLALIKDRMQKPHAKEA